MADTREIPFHRFVLCIFSLKRSSTEEKNALPDASVLAKERREHEHLKNVAVFDKSGLKRTETVEKNSLPDKEAIEGERRASLNDVPAT